MRLVEVGTKSLSKGEKKDAVDLFQKAYQLYNLFWGLNLGVAKMADVKSLTEEKISFINEAPLPESRASLSPFAKLGEIIGRAVDCCRE
jgi:hypothetical protein